MIILQPNKKLANYCRRFRAKCYARYDVIDCDVSDWNKILPYIKLKSRLKAKLNIVLMTQIILMIMILVLFWVVLKTVFIIFLTCLETTED